MLISPVHRHVKRKSRDFISHADLWVLRLSPKKIRKPECMEEDSGDLQLFTFSHHCKQFTHVRPRRIVPEHSVRRWGGLHWPCEGNTGKREHVRSGLVRSWEQHWWMVHQQQRGGVPVQQGSDEIVFAREWDEYRCESTPVGGGGVYLQLWG